MTPRTVPTRPEPQPDHREQVADIVARMLDTGDEVSLEMETGRVGALSELLADAQLLASLVADGFDRSDLEDLAGRLWMMVTTDNHGGLRARVAEQETAVTALEARVRAHLQTCPKATPEDLAWCDSPSGVKS